MSDVFGEIPANQSFGPRLLPATGGNRGETIVKISGVAGDHRWAPAYEERVIDLSVGTTLRGDQDLVFGWTDFTMPYDGFLAADADVGIEATTSGTLDADLSFSAQALPAPDFRPVAEVSMSTGSVRPRSSVPIHAVWETMIAEGATVSIAVSVINRSTLKSFTIARCTGTVRTFVCQPIIA